MENARVWQYLKDHGITQAEAAEATGYTPMHMNAILCGRAEFTDKARVRFVRAYPETAVFLLPEAVAKTTDSNGNGQG